MSPIRQHIPVPPCIAGGNLPRAYSTRAGHFLFPSRTSYGAPCRVLLSSNARTSRDGVACVLGAIRAAGMRERRGHQSPLARGLRRFSLGFHETPDKFGAHNSNRNQALASRGFGRGAAGRVQRFPSRLSIPLQVDDFAHAGNSKSFQSRKRKLMRGAFHADGKIIHERNR